MATISLGHMLMNWTAEFARHAKAKRKRGQKDKDASSEFTSRIARKTCRLDGDSRTSDAQLQTDHGVPEHCNRCQDVNAQMLQLSSSLDQCLTMKKEIKQKLNDTEVALSASMGRETKLRATKTTQELEEAQLRYELDRIKATLSNEFLIREQGYIDQLQQMNEEANFKECAWIKRNEELQNELYTALQSVANDYKTEEQSLDNLEKEIDSLRTVIEMKTKENYALRALNSKLSEKMENQLRVEKQLETAKHRSEELTIILQNKMASERELLELSEALQKDLSQSRDEVLKLKQVLEKNEYILKEALSQEPCTQSQQRRNPKFETQDGGNLTKKPNRQELLSNCFQLHYPQEVDPVSRKTNIEQLKNWVNLTDDQHVFSLKSPSKDEETTSSQKRTAQHCNLHQKASFGRATIDIANRNMEESREKLSSLVWDFKSKPESVSWIIQMPSCHSNGFSK